MIAAQQLNSPCKRNVYHSVRKDCNFCVLWRSIGATVLLINASFRLKLPSRMWTVQCERNAKLQYDVSAFMGAGEGKSVTPVCFQESAVLYSNGFPIKFRHSEGGSKLSACMTCVCVSSSVRCVDHGRTRICWVESQHPLFIMVLM